VCSSDLEEENSTPENLKDFVDESSRLHLTDDDLKKLEEVLLNPPFPNEKLKEAAQKYSEEVREKHTHIDDFDVNQKWDGISQEVWDRMEAIEKQREAIHGPITEEDLPPTGAYANSEYRQRGELLAEIIRNDEELGLYDEPFDNPLIKEEIVNETPITREEIQFVFKENNVDYNDDDISEWDSTLMDGLEDEPPFFTEEELQRFKEMDEMLKVYEEEYVGENIVDYKPTIEEEDENFSTIEPISENIFQEEEISQSLFDEETMEINRSEYQSYLDMEDDFDGFVPEPFATPKELEPITSEPKIDENIKTSSENEDEKKNH
jgi:hypothetical protein